MLRTLQLTLGLILFLIIAGGYVFKTPVGKIEIGSVDPFVWFFAASLLVSAKLRPEAAKQILGKTSRAVEFATHPDRAPLWLALFLAWAASFLFLAHAFRDWSFQTHLFDQAMVHQSLFYPFSDGTWLQSDFSPKRSYLVDHFSPTLLLLAPLASLFRSNLVVFALQALLVAAGVLLLVLRGPLRGERGLYFVAGFLLLTQRSLRAGGIWDFREDLLGYLFLALTIIALQRRRLWFYPLALLAYAFSKEHLALVGLGLLAPIAFDRTLPYSSRERTLLGLGTASLLLIWTAILFRGIIPSLQAGIPDASNIAARFSQFGSTPSEVVTTILTSPAAWWTLLKTQILTWGALKYAALLLAPYLYFGHRAWPWLLAASVGMLANMAAELPMQRSLGFHYDLAFLPFLMTALLAGMRDKLAPLAPPARIRPLLLALLLAVAFSGRWPMFFVLQNLPSFNQVRDARFLEHLSCGRVIAANPTLVAKVAHCPEARVFRLPDLCNEDPAGTFEARNGADATRLPGHSARNATRFVLHLDHACEKAFEAPLLARGARITDHSPSGDIVVLELPSPWEGVNPGEPPR